MEEITRLYKTEKEIPASVKGEHLASPEEQRIKIRLYDSNNPEEYIRFSIGGVPVKCLPKVRW